MTRKEIRINLDKIRNEKDLWEDFEYKKLQNNNRGSYDKNEIKRYALAIELQYDLRNSDYELVRFLMINEIIARRNDSYQGIGYSLRLISYLLSKFKNPENARLFQMAKDANFDTHCGYEREFIFSAGVKKTIDYIKNVEINDENRELEEIDDTPQSLYSEEHIKEFLEILKEEYPTSPEEEDIIYSLYKSIMFKEIEEANKLFEKLEKDEPERYSLLFDFSKDLKNYDKAIYYLEKILENTKEPWLIICKFEDLINIYLLKEDYIAAYNTGLKCDKYLEKVSMWRETGVGRSLTELWFDICLRFINFNKNLKYYIDKSFEKADKLLHELKNYSICLLEKAIECGSKLKKEEKIIEYKELLQIKNSSN